MSDFLRHQRLQPTRLLCPWGFSRPEYGNTLIKEIVFFFLRSEAVWQLLLKCPNTGRDGNFQRLWRKIGVEHQELSLNFRCAATRFRIYIFFFRLLSIIGYHKILNIVPCAIQQVLVVYLFYIQQCVSLNPKLLICLFPPLLSLW